MTCSTCTWTAAPAAEVPDYHVSAGVGLRDGRRHFEVVLPDQTIKLKEFAPTDEGSEKVLIADVMDEEKQVVVARAFEPLTKAVCRQLRDLGIEKCRWWTRPLMTA